MYGKFFSSAFTGSMIASGSDVFAVWGYIVANTFKSTIELNPRLLSAVIGESSERMQVALDFLCSADPQSRTPDQDGRRLIHEGGFQYHVVNHEKYRAIQNEEERREYNRKAKQKERAGKKSSGVKRDVNDSQDLSAHTESRKQSSESSLEAKASMSGKPDDAPRRVLAFLNQKTGKAFRPTESNLSLIRARMKEGYDEDICRMVIARKFRDWKADDKMAGYLRPATLFNREKFNQYAGECVPVEVSDGVS